MKSGTLAQETSGRHRASHSPTVTHRQTERELATGTLIAQEESVFPCWCQRYQLREQGYDTEQLAVTNFANRCGGCATWQLIILSLGENGLGRGSPGLAAVANRGAKTSATDEFRTEFFLLWDP